MTNRRSLPCNAQHLAEAVLTGDRRLMLFGPPGIGKSTLAGQLADALLSDGRSCRCIGADPGSPAFGVPGAVGLAERLDGRWQTIALEPLCTLDAGRFRLPLVSAVTRLARLAPRATLLIDCPGVTRGVAGAELLHGLVEATGADALLAMTPDGRTFPMTPELESLPLELFSTRGREDAVRPGKRTRARSRTTQWDHYLSAAGDHESPLKDLRVLGTPPPVTEPAAWVGRQVALLRSGRLLAMGEVLSLVDGRLRSRARPDAAGADTLLVRDAARSSAGLLVTAPPHSAGPLAYLPPADLLPGTRVDSGPRLSGRIGTVDVVLVNGLFGDPMLHVRLRHQARSLLFDLGDGARLSARIAHQVTDVFISHAHMDHIGGFPCLLRSRIGDLLPCRLFGPPGLAGNIRGLVDGFLWDRVGERGPAFEIAELHGERLHRFRVRAGSPGVQALGEQPAADGVILQGSGFRVRAVTLDHHTPVLAYAYEPEAERNVRKDRLLASGLEPGAWLGELKRHLRAGETQALVRLPDGSRDSVAALARELILTEPGKRLVYATDLADTPDNRARLQALARNAHTLFLESGFAESEARHAADNGHLTARACGEIAEAAGVSRLVPFHLSRRYADDPRVIFDELTASCRCALLPDALGRC